MFCSPFYPRKTSLRHELPPETHTKRQATQHDCLPSLLAMGTKEQKNCMVWKTIFCTGLTRAAKAEQNNSCNGMTSPTNPPAKDPFNFFSQNPLLPQFEQSAGTIPLQTLWIPLTTLRKPPQLSALLNCIGSITSGNIFCLLLCVSLSAMHYTSPNFFGSCKF